MRIILEGCDGVGKTTLANILAKKYNLDICHCTSYDPADFMFYYQSVRKNNIIWDRHTVGELIYPKVFNRHQQICTEDARIVINYFRELGGKIFVLTADDDIINDRLIARESEDEQILFHQRAINEAFIKYANAFCIPIINTSKMTLNEIFELVEE